MVDPEDQDTQDTQDQQSEPGTEDQQDLNPVVGAEAEAGADQQGDTLDDAENAQDNSGDDGQDQSDATGQGDQQTGVAGTGIPDPNVSTSSQDDTDEDEGGEDEGEEEREPTLFDKYSDPVARIARRLETYITQMRPSHPQTVNTGKYQQRELYGIYMSVLDLPAGAFNEGMDMLLSYFNEHRRGALSQRLINRFLPNVPQRPENTRAMEALNRLFTVVADPSTRDQAIKHVDLHKVVERLDNPEQADKLLSYFDVS